MIPIAILAFNRPHYLERVLRSIRDQRDVDLAQHPVHFFQDGAVSEFSGKRHAEEADVDRNCQLVRELLPEATIYRAPQNLGIAMNFDRAERKVFEDLDAEVAFFLEDDLELGPYYLKTMNTLARLTQARKDVGYFAAYGDLNIPEVRWRARPNALVPLGHNWAFGLTQAQWKKSSFYVDQYLSLVRGQDYRARPVKQIGELFHSWGYGAPGTSQDVAKTLACYVTGAAKLNTIVPFGRYIGEVGTHSTTAHYEAEGYGKVVVSEEDIFAATAITDADVQASMGNLSIWANEEHVPSAGRRAATAGGWNEDEMRLLRRYLDRSEYWLEFGAGPSTKLAIEQSKARILSVESDAAVVSDLKRSPEVMAAIRAERLAFHVADIGPVGAAGAPSNESRLKNWHAYYAAAWTQRDWNYDFVLIDGRFRVQCALAAAAFAGPETLIGIHDYPRRSHYHVVEKYFDTVERAGDLHVFRKRPNMNMRAWTIDFCAHLYDTR